MTASEDDSSPIIMVWDLRNARAPEKVVHHFLVTSCPINAIFQILTGHDKGVLSLSWCKQDADLLLSCGKDNRALCWSPQTSEIIGEVCHPSSIDTLALANSIKASFARQLGFPSRLVPS